jgi:hypothetical protein
MNSIRTIRLLTAIVSVFGAAALLSACGGGAASSKPPASVKPSASASTAAALASLPPAQILSKALAAAQAQGPVHFSETSRSASGTSSYDQNASSDGGNQIIRNSSGKVTVRMVAGVGYFRADATALAQLFPGKAVSQLAGRWIVAHPGDPGYQNVTVGITLPSILAECTPTGSLTSTGPQTINGQSVIGVKGVAPANAGVPQGEPVTLYVLATGQPLPVSFQGGSGADQVTATFSKWGEAASTAAPANPLPITSVTGS